MSYSNVNGQGEYAALVEGAQGEGYMNANTQDYYDMYGNNITGETINNAVYMDNPTNMGNVANTSNGGGVDEEAPLGTPLTYVIGNEGEYCGSVDYGQIGEILSKYGKCLESCPTSDHLGEKQSNELVTDGDKKKKSFFEDSFFFFDKNKKREITDKKGNKTTNVVYSDYTKMITAVSLVWFLLWTCAYVYVMTAGTLYEQRLNLELDSNGNSEIVSLQKVFYYFKSSYFFSILWIYLYFFICEILQSLNQFTISYLGAVWYFCDKNSLNYNLSAGATMRTILSYHFGSLVLSSFINLCTKHFRVFFFWTNSTLSLPFFFSDLIHSLKGRFHFVLKPISRLIDMYTISAYCEITYVLNIIFPCFTTLVVTFFSFNIFNSFQTYNDLFSPSFIPNPFFVSLTIGVLCGVITSYFITIVSTLADSVLYCFICECYQKQMIDENPLRKIYTPTLLRELILEMYEEYSTRM
ncbi:inner membrane complex suture component, putative [Plasmodium ovale wallikeri]|uniref:Choline transporter-like protein n=1 Tax=Plasmodium ovale wallikeri TaxID=864142 RepID=A0A1A8YGS9_PLAOA|nr:inner membrane complex suture component, putative [Plasmodium ovale wallikeri]SBT45556.1 inner membrane complex suture component, putative [Plasmodium ovale wallikeri]